MTGQDEAGHRLRMGEADARASLAAAEEAVRVARSLIQDLA